MGVRFILATALLLFSGCTLHFTKPGLTQQEFKKDWTECQALMGQSFGGKPGLVHQNSFMTDCMEGRGYTKQ